MRAAVGEGRCLLKRFAVDPTVSAPKTCRGCGETMGVYRLFGSAVVVRRDS
jgi:hypothetical protein